MVQGKCAPALTPELPRQEHGNLTAVVLIRLAQDAFQFALFQQGSDNKITRKDGPGHQGDISEVRQGPEQGQTTTVPGVADVTQNPGLHKSRGWGCSVGLIIPPLLHADKYAEIINPQAADKQDQGIEKQQALQDQEPACRSKHLVLRQGVGVVKQGQQGCEGTKNIAKPKEGEPRATPRCNPAPDRCGYQQTVQTTPGDPKKNQKAHQRTITSESLSNNGSPGIFIPHHFTPGSFWCTNGRRSISGSPNHDSQTLVAL